MITGDFFTTKDDINTIESSLRYTRADYGEILNSLGKIWREEMIWGISPEDLAETILNSKQQKEFKPSIQKTCI